MSLEVLADRVVELHRSPRFPHVRRFAELNWCCTASGSSTTSGLEFAERALREQRVNRRAFVRALRGRGARARGTGVEPLRALIDQLRGDGFTGGVSSSGQAVRREAHQGGRPTACRAVTDALFLLTAAR